MSANDKAEDSELKNENLLPVNIESDKAKESELEAFFDIDPSVFELPALSPSRIALLQERFGKRKRKSIYRLSVMSDNSKIDRLTKSNYESWRVQIEAVLQKQNCWLDLDKADKDDKSYEKLVKQAYFEIVLRCDAEHAKFAKSVGEYNSVKVLTALREKYEGKGVFAKLELLQKVLMMRHQSGPIDDHIDNMRMCYQRLTEKGLVLQEILQVATLMISVPQEYGSVMSSFLNVDENDLKFENLANAILSEQRRQSMSETNVTASSSMINRIDRRKNLKCTFCGKKGHIVDSCFIKQGIKCTKCDKVGHRAEKCRAKSEIRRFPQHSSSNFTSMEDNAQELQQTSMYAGAHKAFTSIDFSIANNNTAREKSTVFSRLEQPHKRLRSHVDVNNPPSTPGKNIRFDNDNWCFTTEKANDESALELHCDEFELKNLLNKSFEIYSTAFFSSSNLKKNSDWIVDSGASIHMSHDKKIFRNLTLKDCGSIKIANGTTIPIRGFGSIVIMIHTKSEPISLLLKNVVYAPDLHLNLMSVFELNKAGHAVLFEKTTCNIKVGNDLIKIAEFIDNNYIVHEDLNATASPCVHEWHRRLAHRNLRDVKHLKDFGLNIKKCLCQDQCDACMKGKSTELSFSPAVKPENPLDIIVSDICGPLRTQSLGGAKYFLTITDVSSDYTEVRFLSHKNEASKHIMNFVEFTKTQMSSKMKIFRSDGGGEFVSNELRQYLTKEGIQIQTTTPYTPQQNGIAERKNRTLNDAVRTVLIAANLPDNLWAEAMHYVVYTQNRIVRKENSFAPIERFFGKQAKATFIEFGRNVYVTTPQQGRGKLEPRAEVMRFLSVDDKAKGFRLWNGSKIIVSRNIRPKLDTEIIYSEPLIQSSSIPPSHSMKDKNDDDSCTETTLRRSARIRERNKSEIANSTRQCLDADPKTYKEAISSVYCNQWIKAMQEELESLRSTKTYELKDLPAGRKAIGCKWVFKRKTEDGKIRFKARLVAKGFSQKYGEDYDEVFAPVARAPTIRLLLSMAGKLNFHVKQFDVKTAFLNGSLDEEIYMKQPEGFEKGEKVLHLKKSLYGLKQAARSWNIMLKGCLDKIGFKQSDADECLFIKKINQELCYIVVHVDDMLFAASSLDTINDAFKELSKDFELKDLGQVNHFLGIDIYKSEKGFYGINQSNYITKIAEELNLDQAKAQKYPIQQGYYKLDCEDLLPSNKTYRKIIGMLLYISTHSRPDISLSVCVLAQRVETPRQLDLDEAYRVVKYLLSTKDHVLHLNNDEIIQSLTAFSDANHAECRIDRKSNSGIICFVNGGPIIWSSKKQSLVALSTCEAEYYAIAEAAKEVIWLRKLLESFDVSYKMSTPILTDNQSTIRMIENGDFMQRTKYIGVRYHFIRDWIEKGLISLRYCPSEYNIADMLTKPLCGPKIQDLRKSAGLLHPSELPSKDTNHIMTTTTSALHWNLDM